MSTDRIAEYLSQFAQTRTTMLDQLRRVVVGQAEVIDQILAAIFTRGHCLLIGVPGLAKTLMVSSISRILDVSFKRIQFTPDLMPSDITGTMVLDENEQGRREFRFVKGPIFANIVLADEINRTPPKTQAALLEAMQERQVTTGQDTHGLPDPFFVIATQNPIEQEGTYPLPEAQLDRFMFTIKVNYPSLEEEKRILAMRGKSDGAELSKVFERQGDPERAEADRQRAGERFRQRIHRPSGTRLPAAGCHRSGVRQADGRLRRRTARWPVSAIRRPRPMPQWTADSASPSTT